MKSNLENGQPASEEAIQTLETGLGFRLCASFRAFLREHDGAKPGDNKFSVGDYTDSSVNRFIPVNKILEKRDAIGDLPEKAYPVARDSFGNYVFIDEGKNGAVFFWDHELPDGITELAPNLQAFLELLEPDIEE